MGAILWPADHEFTCFCVQSNRGYSGFTLATLAGGLVIPTPFFTFLGGYSGATLETEWEFVLRFDVTLGYSGVALELL